MVNQNLFKFIHINGSFYGPMKRLHVNHGEKIAKEKQRDVAGNQNVSNRTRLDRYHLSICSNDVKPFIQLLFMIIIFVANTYMGMPFKLLHTLKDS